MYMKKALCLILVCSLITGCAFMKSVGGVINKGVKDINKPIPSQIYKEKVYPLILVIDALYGNKINVEQRNAFVALVKEMNRQADTQPTVSVLPAILSAATPILLSKVDAKISKNQALAGLVGLESLKDLYQEGNLGHSSILETLYPLMKTELTKQIESK